jgi:hypothetical protein
MEEEDHSTLLNSLLSLVLLQLLPLQLSFSLFSRSLTLYTLSHLLSNNYTSFIGKYGQHWWDKEALKHATSGINGATTCLVVGYYVQMAIS